MTLCSAGGVLDLYYVLALGYIAFASILVFATSAFSAYLRHVFLDLLLGSRDVAPQLSFLFSLDAEEARTCRT